MGRPAACLLNRSLIETQTVSASIISPILIFEEAAALGRIQLKLAVEIVMSRLAAQLSAWTAPSGFQQAVAPSALRALDTCPVDFSSEPDQRRD